MVVIICDKYGNNRSRTENVTKRTRFSKSRSNDLEDIGQGQRPSHATHLLMLVINCFKYGNNPSTTVDATERTWFSRPGPNDLEDIGLGQRSLYATHLLLLVIICAKYGKNPSRTVDFFFKVKAENFLKIAKNSNFLILKKTHPLLIVIICATYKKNPSRTEDATERTRFSKSRPNDLEDVGQGQRSSHATHPLMLLIICTKCGKNPSWTVDATGRTRKVNGQTGGQTDRQGESNIPPNFVARGIMMSVENIELDFDSIEYKCCATGSPYPNKCLSQPGGIGCQQTIVDFYWYVF